MQLLQFGSLTVPLHWLLAIGSLFVGWGVSKVYITVRHIEKETLDIIINSLFVLAAVWKLSIVIFYFEMVRSHLASALYFTGGTKGFLLGICISIPYLLSEGRKKKVLRSLSQLVLLFGSVSYGMYLFLSSLLERAPVVILISFMLTIILIVVWLWDASVKGKIPEKAGTIFLIYAMIFQVGRETSLSEWAPVICFPLVAMILYNVSAKKEIT